MRCYYGYDDPPEAVHLLADRLLVCGRLEDLRIVSRYLCADCWERIIGHRYYTLKTDEEPCYRLEGKFFFDEYILADP